MSGDTAQRTPAADRRPGPLVLSLLVFGGTLAWTVRFGVSYAVVPDACARGEGLLHVVTLLAVVGAVAAFVASWRVARHLDDPPRRFVLLAGMALDVFFLGAILLEGSAVFFVDACTKGAV